jgi:hypothetical protein
MQCEVDGMDCEYVGGRSGTVESATGSRICNKRQNPWYMASAVHHHKVREQTTESMVRRAGTVHQRKVGSVKVNGSILRLQI